MKPSCVVLDLFDDLPSDSVALLDPPTAQVQRKARTAPATPKRKPAREAPWEPIRDDVAVVLAGAETGPDFIKIHEQLASDLYDRVNETIRRLGGRWKSGRGTSPEGTPNGRHRFDYDPRPLLDLVIERRAVPPKNPTAFFPTSAPVATQMVEWADLPIRWHHPDGIVVLEPSAGHGAIADAIRAAHPDLEMHLQLIELLPENAAVLRAKGYQPLEMDFLDHRPREIYTAALMNPPFSAAGAPLLWLDHVEHAYSLLRMGGVLVAIVPSSFRTSEDARVQAFRELVFDHDGEVEDLDRGAFKEAGTMVGTCMVFLTKEDTSWKRRPVEGYASWHAYSADLLASTSGAQYQAQRQRIWRGIHAGTLNILPDGSPDAALRQRIERYYREAEREMNRNAGGPLVRLTEEDIDSLAREFIHRGAPA